MYDWIQLFNGRHKYLCDHIFMVLQMGERSFNIEGGSDGLFMHGSTYMKWIIFDENIALVTPYIGPVTSLLYSEQNPVSSKNIHRVK